MHATNERPGTRVYWFDPRYFAPAAALAAAVWLIAAAGCARTVIPGPPASSQGASASPAATQPSLTAEAAKRAVVELIRTHRNTFIGNPDPDRLAALPLIDFGDGSYAFGVIVVNPTEGWYNATAGQDAPEVYQYTGRIVLEGNTWVATEPTVARFWKHP